MKTGVVLLIAIRPPEAHSRMMEVGDRVRFKKSFPLSKERAGKTGVVTEIVPAPHHGNPLLVVRLDDGRVADGVLPELVDTIVGH